MRLLVLGGTVFLGRAVARHARDAGHDVTCAARGHSGAPPEGVRFVAIDRDAEGGLAPLDGERFDAVVDVARRPSQVRAAVAALGDRVGHWVYVSTCSVYADNATPGQRAADAPLLPSAPPGEDLDDQAGGPEAYGRNKVACEQAVTAGVGAGRSMLCRAGLIVGPEDGSGRFEYWVRRVARAGEVLAPGAPTDPVQLVDVRDLAAWLVEAGEGGLSGVYDGSGAPLPRAEFLAGLARGVGVWTEERRERSDWSDEGRRRPTSPGPARAERAPEALARGVGGAGPDVTWTWVDQEFLVEREVQPWMGPRSLPLWLPLPEYAGFLARDVSPALAAGLRTRPLADTAGDTLAWLADQPTAIERCGLSAVDEAALLREWHSTAR